MQVAKIYAKALYDLTKKARGEKQEKIFNNFVNLLKSKGHYSLMPLIFKHLKLLVEKDKLDNIDLIVAKENDFEKYFKKADNFKKHFYPKKEIKKVIDSSIVGGFIIKTKELMVDKSYKRSLINLYNNIIK